MNAAGVSLGAAFFGESMFHRARDASACALRFSPDSQRVLFQTDRDGKPAIYMLDVQRLVERTDF